MKRKEKSGRMRIMIIVGGMERERISMINEECKREKRRTISGRRKQRAIIEKGA